MDGNLNFSRYNVNQFMDTPSFQRIRSDRFEGNLKLSSGTYQITWNRGQAQVSRTDKSWCSSFADFFARGCCSPTRASQLQTELNIRPALDNLRLPDPNMRQPLLLDDHLSPPAAPPDIEIFTKAEKGKANAIAYKGRSEAQLPLDVPVTRIRLRGDGVGGGHQELMITLGNGKLVRISRNRGEDTFQYGAQERGGLMPTIKGYDLSLEGTGKTLEHVLEAFKREHVQRPSYDDGNCQVLAQNIYKELTSS